MERFTVEEWEWAIVNIMTRDPQKQWSRDEIGFEAEILLERKFPKRSNK